MLTVSISELAADMNHYVSLLVDGDILITRDEKPVARLTSADADALPDNAERTARMSALKSLFGILPPDVDLDRSREERLS